MFVFVFKIKSIILFIHRNDIKKNLKTNFDLNWYNASSKSVMTFNFLLSPYTCIEKVM